MSFGGELQKLFLQTLKVDPWPRSQPKSGEMVHRGYGLRAKALAARAGRRRIRIRDFEAAALQVAAEIQFRSCHVQGAFRVYDYANPARFHQDIPVRRSVLEIHLV